MRHLARRPVNNYYMRLFSDKRPATIEAVSKSHLIRLRRIATQSLIQRRSKCLKVYQEFLRNAHPPQADCAFSSTHALRHTLIYENRHVIPLYGVFGRDLRLVRRRRGYETTSKNLSAEDRKNEAGHFSPGEESENTAWRHR